MGALKSLSLLIKAAGGAASPYIRPLNTGRKVNFETSLNGSWRVLSCSYLFEKNPHWTINQIGVQPVQREKANWDGVIRSLNSTNISVIQHKVPYQFIRQVLYPNPCLFTKYRESLNVNATDTFGNVLLKMGKAAGSTDTLWWVRRWRVPPTKQMKGRVKVGITWSIWASSWKEKTSRHFSESSGSVSERFDHSSA